MIDNDMIIKNSKQNKKNSHFIQEYSFRSYIFIIAYFFRFTKKINKGRH